MNTHSLDLEKNRRRTRLYIDAMAEMPLSIDVVDERHVLVVVVIVIMLVCRGRESWNPVSALHSSTATSRRHIFANLSSIPVNFQRQRRQQNTGHWVPLQKSSSFEFEFSIQSPSPSP